MRIVSLLLYLGKKGAINRYITVTTPKMGSELGMSQQSVSRWLITLETKGLIERKQGIRGYMVKITPDGKDVLVEMRNELNDVIAESGKMVMGGRVVSGMLDGKYYLGFKEYIENIKAMLGFRPFPGTLNIKLNTMDDTQCKERLCAMKGTEIPGFRKGDKIFGSLNCFQCRVGKARGAVLIPERSHYGFDVIEVISRFNLRKRLNLSDGDDVEVQVMVDR